LKTYQIKDIKYNTLVYEKQRGGEDIIVLSLGEAFFDIPLFSFENLPIQKIYHYSHSRGIPELREKLANYFFEAYDVIFDYEKEILVTAGSKIAIHMCLMTVINPGDEVIIHEPAWVSYPEQIKLCYGIPVQVPYYKSVYDFEEYITNKTRMIIINNPNKPSGKVYTLDELTFLHNLAKKHQIYILSDEAYSDFVLNQDEFISFAHLDTKKEHSIVINSISKNFGISGWRLGYLITNADLVNQVLKLNQHLVTCAPTILEYYVAKYFDNIIEITKPQINQLVKKRQEVAHYMKSISITSLPGNTTFYFFTSIKESKLSSDEFCSKLLHEYHVSTVPGIGYGKSCDKFIRISIGSENIERIKSGLNAIKNLILTTSI
jgi:aspartate aminotransferase/aminotransferase